MDLADATPFLTDHQQAVVVTVGEQDVPHASNVLYHFDGDTFRVSVTDDRVKTTNLRRRPLALMHVSSEDFWRWVAAECDADLSPVSAEAGDAVGQELLDLYETLTGPHPHPEEFLQAMVDDHRLVLRLTARRVYGQLG
ncbi:MAG TPA: TIGR03618 family F420-dependent PPOX class oxidoreductase [Euzebya sp.]|nr:TIGR03618 family F420-dependent PPOX class oxidoreductase [Euzebya sp.]